MIKEMENEIVKSIRERSLIECGLYNARKMLKYKRYCLRNAKSLEGLNVNSWLMLASKTDEELNEELDKISDLCKKYYELYSEEYESIRYAQMRMTTK